MTSDELKEVYASAPVSSTDLEVISLSAPWFTKIYYLQNVDTDPIDVVLETNETVTVYYAPIGLGQTSSNADLNYERSIIIEEVNDIIASEQANFNPDVHNPDDAKISSRGYIYYRNGTVSAIQTSVTTVTIREVVRSAKSGSVNISASSTPANETSTGEVATISRVPMLKGFL